MPAPRRAPAGAQATLSLTHALGGSAAILLFGQDPAAIPMGLACTLNVTPVLPVVVTAPVAGSGPGNGKVSFTGVIPAASTASFTLQAFVADPGVPAGFSATNGLRVNVE